MAYQKAQYWLWVTRPEFYLDDFRNEREDLDPELAPDAEHWWTCDKDTRAGDLALLYRTAPRSDIAYLILAASDAVVIEHEFQAEHGWAYKCDCQVLCKFASPVTYHTLKSDPYLEDWKAVRGRFQSSTWFVETSHWSRLIELLTKHNPTFGGFYSSLEQQQRYKGPKNERRLEDRLEADLHALSRFGHDLELVKRQYICEPVGRIDLLCRDRSTGRYVVIELKDERAGLSTFGQVSAYMGWVQANLAGQEAVVGMVISHGYDIRFDSALRSNSLVQHIDVADLAADLR